MKEILELIDRGPNNIIEMVASITIWSFVAATLISIIILAFYSVFYFQDLNYIRNNLDEEDIKNIKKLRTKKIKNSKK